MTEPAGHQVVRFLRPRCSFRRLCAIVLAAVTVVSGCTKDDSVRGGTTGRVTMGGEPFPEIQVTVFRGEPNDALKLGFGVTGMDGRVELLAEEATGPLWLIPGEYLVTVESIGPTLAIPRDCLDVKRTPLRLTIGEDSTEFTLDIALSPKPTGRTK